MLHGTHREVAFCLFLLCSVVSTTLYFTVFSLHGSNTALKLQLKSRMIHQIYQRENVFDYTDPNSAFLMAVNSNSNTNYSINFGADGSMPLNAGEIHNQDEMQYHRDGMKNHAFNVLISDRIGLTTRPIPDSRNKACQKKVYSNISITASVIICFHKEALSTLLRTVASVVYRTPSQLLHEVILVDDFSDVEEINVQLPKYLNEHYPYGKVHLLHSSERIGLMQARVKGAKEAIGDVLIFLDSHCEPNVGWIEPLLDIIQNSRSTLVCPIVDIINSHTLAYTASPVVRGGFNWGLHFSWEANPNEVLDPSLPYTSPTMSGGLFAVDRKYFKEIGYYDEGMREWGGENLELSFRVWMCGGKLVISPCSRVGHIFRMARPNTIRNTDNPTRNAARLAEVWLDDYKQYFLRMRPSAKMIDFDDVRDRKLLRKKLHCHNFQWYLENIYPEIEIPGVRKSKVVIHRDTTKNTDILQGAIKVPGIDLCLRADDNKRSMITAVKCDRNSINQSWKLTSSGELRFGLNNRMCMDAAGLHSPVLMKCDSGGGSQKWFFHPRRVQNREIIGKLYSASEGLCIRLNGGDLTDKYELVMEICRRPTVQMFEMVAL